MYLCYNCGAPAADEVEVCPQCGTQFGKPRTYRPATLCGRSLVMSGLMCMGILALGLTLFMAISTSVVGLPIFLNALANVDFSLSRAFGTGSSGRGLSLSTAIILLAVVGFSVLMILAANRFFKRK